MRRMGLLRVIAEAEMLRLDLRRVVRRPLRPEPRLPDLPRRIRVCRLVITRQAVRELQTVHLLPLPTVEQAPPAVIRPADLDTPTAAQVPGTSNSSSGSASTTAPSGNTTGSNHYYTNTGSMTGPGSSNTNYNYSSGSSGTAAPGSPGSSFSSSNLTEYQTGGPK